MLHSKNNNTVDLVHISKKNFLNVTFVCEKQTKMLPNF